MLVSPPPRSPHAALSARGIHPVGWRPGALVAESDPDLRRIIVDALTQDGFVVSEARDADELVEIAYCTRQEDNSPPALVVSDVQLSGCGGFRALDELQPTLAGAVILVISACLDELVLAEAWRVGAAGVLGKPFALDELRSAALALVGR